MHERSGLGKREAAGVADKIEQSRGAAARPDWALPRAALFERLNALGLVHHTIEHPAFFTVEDGRAFKAGHAGGHSKNLALKDKKGGRFLAVALAETKVDLIGLGKAIGARGRLSFASGEQMTALLGVVPGSVTPFALMHDQARALDRVILDTALLACDPVWFHPFENTASTAISPDALIRFVQSCGFTPEILDLAAPYRP